MLICTNCQTNLEHLHKVFNNLYGNRIKKYLDDNGIKNIQLARNSIDVSCADIFDKLHISPDRYHCRATLMSGRTQLELLGFGAPFVRATAPN